MPTRNVVLTESQTRFVEHLVACGRYQNASEVLREGLRLVQASEEEQSARLAALRQAAAVGIADIEDGRFITFDTSQGLEEHLRALSEEAIKAAGAR